MEQATQKKKLLLAGGGTHSDTFIWSRLHGMCGQHEEKKRKKVDDKSHMMTISPHQNIGYGLYLALQVNRIVIICKG